MRGWGLPGCMCCGGLGELEVRRRRVEMLQPQTIEMKSQAGRRGGRCARGVRWGWRRPGRLPLLASWIAGRVGEECGCSRVGVQGVQQLGAECNFSMQGKARGLSMEGVGECGTAERLVRSLAQGLARRASSGSGAWALCGNSE